MLLCLGRRAFLSSGAERTSLLMLQNDMGIKVSSQCGTLDKLGNKLNSTKREQKGIGLFAYAWHVFLFGVFVTKVS